jgi:hypothetical protein
MISTNPAIHVDVAHEDYLSNHIGKPTTKEARLDFPPPILDISSSFQASTSLAFCLDLMLGRGI